MTPFFIPTEKLVTFFPLFFVSLLRERMIHLRDMLELLEFFDDNNKIKNSGYIFSLSLAHYYSDC